MKTVIYSLITVVIIGTVGWAYLSYAAYLPGYSRSVAAAVLIDKTENLEAQPTGTDILSPLNLAEHRWESIELNVRTFSKYEYTESYSLSLPSHFFLLSNPDERDKEIAGFVQKTDSVINTINKQKNGFPKSSIYAPLVEEVNKIARAKTEVKTVFAYTDGFENTTTFSIYKERDRKLLIEHPEKVKELLSQFGKPADLHNVKIYFVFKPKTDLDNEYYTLMIGFYKKIFNDAGATVYIGANLVAENN